MYPIQSIALVSVIVHCGWVLNRYSSLTATAPSCNTHASKQWWPFNCTKPITSFDPVKPPFQHVTHSVPRTADTNQGSHGAVIPWVSLSSLWTGFFISHHCRHEQLHLCSSTYSPNTSPMQDAASNHTPCACVQLPQNTPGYTPTPHAVQPASNDLHS